MIDLYNEHADAVCNLPPQTIDRLTNRFGIPENIIFDLPLRLGVTRAQTYSAGFYEPADDGDHVLIIAAGEADDVAWLGLDDLIAIKPQDPGKWWRRLGTVEVIGLENIKPEQVFPIVLHDTPLSWLQAGATGVCVIDWRFDPEVLVGPIEVETPALKARLEQRIQAAALSKFTISTREVTNAA